MIENDLVGENNVSKLAQKELTRQMPGFLLKGVSLNIGISGAGFIK